MNSQEKPTMNSFYMNLLVLILLLPVLTGCVPMAAMSIGTGLDGSSLVTDDRRTSGIFIEDEVIESKSEQRIREQLGNLVHINTTSFNRIVLLTGEAPDEAMVEQIERLVMSVENIRNIINEIKVAKKSSFISRANDSLITSKVKGRFLMRSNFKLNHIKVLTENRVVYLMGVVTHEEAESATDISSTTAGVSKVIRIFEYLN
jgi:osmotically-inducible protein OsmY